jgi:hypothetical protein
MKTLQTHASTILLAVMASTLVSGCVTSSSTVVPLNIKQQPATVIEVMPISAAQKRFVTSDWWRRGIIVGGVIDANTGIYTYKFDDKDYANLRKSVIDSLQKGNYFKEVNDVSNDVEAGTGTRLYINFSESGMGSTTLGGFTCTLKAYAWTEDATGALVAKKEVSVLEKSEITVGIAKNKAITKFVQEVSKLFVAN